MRLSTGAIFLETRPDTIITSAWRGDARNVSAPNLDRSFLAETVFIISIAQQARPKVAGQRLDFRAQLTTASSLTVTTSGRDSKSVFSKPIFTPPFSAVTHLHAGVSPSTSLPVEPQPELPSPNQRRPFAKYKCNRQQVWPKR